MLHVGGVDGVGHFRFAWRRAWRPATIFDLATFASIGCAMDQRLVSSAVSSLSRVTGSHVLREGVREHYKAIDPSPDIADNCFPVRSAVA